MKEPLLAKYLCQMIDYDGEDDWSEVNAYDSESAAKLYADNCKSRSGGEMLNTEDDIQRVWVKLEGSDTPLLYNVTMYWREVYMARVTTTV